MDLVCFVPVGVAAVMLLLFGGAVAVALGHPARGRRADARLVMELIMDMVRILVRLR